MKSERLKYLLKNKIAVSFAVDDEEYYGFIVDYSDYFFCIAKIETWHLDGCMIIPRQKCGTFKEEKFQTKVFIFKEEINNIHPLKFLSLSNYKELFLSIKKNSNFVSLESKTEYAVGKILKVYDEKITLEGYSPVAEKEEGHYIVPYGDLPTVILHDEYATVIAQMANNNLA